MSEELKNLLSEELKDELTKIFEKAMDEIANLVVSQELDQAKIEFLGKKGQLTDILRKVGTLSPEERPMLGSHANEIREKIANAIEEKRKQLVLKDGEKKIATEKIDVTLPSRRTEYGKRHPISTIIMELEDIFIGMGFDVVSGPEIEYDYYNFTALNMPLNHPARDLQDTFYINKDNVNTNVNEDVVLRTQTSSVQIRIMEKTMPPIRMVCPGRVYRCDSIDATHFPIFHQIEGLVVDKNITMNDLRDTIELFVQALLGSDTKIRFRPHYFPYTEPSAEVDVQCFICGGKDDSCSLCKGEGWMEILGSGMVHPKVLSQFDINPDIYTGFAFGMGLDRLAIAKYGIDDIRLLFENDIRFLRQF